MLGQAVRLELARAAAVDDGQPVIAQQNHIAGVQIRVEEIILQNLSPDRMKEPLGDLPRLNVVLFEPGRQAWGSVRFTSMKSAMRAAWINSIVRTRRVE